jgi:glycosyltransferase involved in cell wall biosynthesis
MKPEPLVSAIIPTYNRAHTVCEAIDSILNQTYPNIELIVVDDGSTDDTAGALRRYGSTIRIITQQNAGPSVARNRGIAGAAGSIVAFLDSDDLWLPGKIERQVALLERMGSSVPCCLSNISMRWNTGERSSFEIAGLNPPIEEGIWLNPEEVLATRVVLFTQGVAIRRSVLEKIGGFDERLRLLEDHELALRLSAEGPWAFIKDPMVIWRESKGSLYQTARGQDLRVAETYVRILRERLEKRPATRVQPHVSKHLRREIDSTLRQIRAVKVGQRRFWGAAAAGKVLRKMEHCHNAIRRRTPGYPAMKVKLMESRAEASAC